MAAWRGFMELIATPSSIYLITDRFCCEEVTRIALSIDQLDEVAPLNSLSLPA